MAEKLKKTATTRSTTISKQARRKASYIKIRQQLIDIINHAEAVYALQNVL